MFAREIESRQRKFEKESIERKLKEKQKYEKRERERLAEQKRREELEKRAKEKQLREERLRQQEEERQEELRENNRGVFYEATLSPSTLSDEIAASYGIKRWMDKVILPVSMSNELMRQEAYRNGALLFELTAENGNRTHVGVLKFSAAEGSIQIPAHVRRCLWGQDGECKGDVKVCYRRLQNGSFARLQPLKQGFHEAVYEDMKEILEKTLSLYSTLTEGDIIEIPLLDREQTHYLKVVELEPARAVSILQTDLEVDILPSAELEETLKSRLQKTNRMSFGPSKRQKSFRIAKDEDAEPSSSDRQHDELLTYQGSDKQVTENQLSPEVPEDAEDAITCSIRYPNGTSVQRTFRMDDALSNLFDFVRIKDADQSLGADYQLVTQFPRCVFSRETHGNSTFRENAFEKRQLFYIKTNLDGLDKM